MTERTDILRTQLEQLESWQQLTFAAAMVQRMAPNFVLFAELVAEQSDSQLSSIDPPVEQWPKIFRNVLSLVWEHCTGVNAQIDFHKQLAKVEAITPDPEAYDFYGVYPALDTVAALSALVSCAEKLDSEELLQIAELSSATIYGYLEAMNLVGEAEDQHPLLLTDVAFSGQVLEQLKLGSVSVKRRDQVVNLRRWVQDEGVSNIGLTL